MCFLFVGGMMSLLGGVLTWNGRKRAVVLEIPSAELAVVASAVDEPGSVPGGG